jgi:regulator of cell morphogenesis and NO signaling
MRITDALRAEHAVLTAKLEELERTLARNTHLAELKSKAARLAADLLPHAKLEDELLFPALPSLSGQSGPIAMMRIEHEEIESSLLRIANEFDRPRLLETLKRVLTVARQHFVKEDEVLFPMAEEFLGEPRLAELGAKFAEFREREPLTAS